MGGAPARRLIHEGYKASDKRETGSETAGFSDDKAYTLRPSGASVMAKTQPSFWSITAFSGRHGITLWRPFPRPLIPKTRFLSQKSDELSANNGICLFASIPHKEDAHIGDVRGEINFNLDPPALRFYAQGTLPNNFAGRNC